MTATHASLHLMLDGDTTADITVKSRPPGAANGNPTDTFIDVRTARGDLCISGPPEQVEAFCRRLHLAAVAAVDQTWQPAPGTLAAARERLRDDAATIQHLVTEPSAG